MNGAIPSSLAPFFQEYDLDTLDLEGIWPFRWARRLTTAIASTNC